MLCGAIAVLFSVGLFSPGQGTTAIIATSASVNITFSAISNQTSNAGPSSTMSFVVKPSSTDSNTAATGTNSNTAATGTDSNTAATSTDSNTAATSTPPATTTTPMASSSSSTPGTSPSASVTPQPQKQSCFSISFIAKRAWNESLSESQSALHNETSEEISKAIQHLFNESSKYQDVKVSEHKYSEKDGDTYIEKVKLCLVVKTSDGTVIDDVFIEQVKSGYLMEGFQVDKDSFEFEPLGVELKDWKAKDDECDKCDGAAGEFTIEGTCVSKAWSCRGVKKTMMTKDCVKYCGDSSAGTYTVSFLILTMGIFFSFSFQ